MLDRSTKLIELDLFAEEVGSESLSADALPDTAAPTNTVGTASCVGCITGTASTTFCAMCGIG